MHKWSIFQDSQNKVSLEKYRPYNIFTEADLGGGMPGARYPPPPSHPTPIFCNHFEELQTVLFEVELIVSNAPLIRVYPKTIKTCLTPNYLLFGKQLI